MANISNTSSKMASKSLCTIEGCLKQRHADGMCQMHRYRVKHHGSPTSFSERHLKKVKWVNEAAKYEKDDCLKWPFSASAHGRGTVNLFCRTLSAPRALCIIAHGEPPTPKHQAAHICGNGHLGCMNPKHLRWATGSENELDKILHGTVRRGVRINTAKLTENCVREIRQLIFQGRRVKEIAHNYNVTIGQIYDIKNKVAWAWLE